MTSSWIEPQATICIDPAVLTRSVGDHLVIYNPINDQISHLDPIGSHVWALLHQSNDLDPNCLGDISGELSETFDVDQAIVITDVATLISKLLESGVAHLHGRA